MRVIAGTARGHKLFSPEGLDTRPTADRIKESLFNILMNELREAAFLDLYSGTGAIGIEALSRGAKNAVFVDNNAKSIDVIYKNLAKTRFTDRATVMKATAAYALRRLDEEAFRFDIIFMDPPYYTDDVGNAIREIMGRRLLKDGGLIAVEIAGDQDLPIAEGFGLEIYKRKNYHMAQILFLRKEQL